MGRKKQNKKAHKTIRLTEQDKFAVTFLAQREGQTGNAFVGSAVQRHAKAKSAEHKLPLSEIWHIDESIRTLRWFALSDDVYPFDDEQQQQRDFILRHFEFFYVKDGDARRVNEKNARELMPRLGEWRATEGDHWAAGAAMVKHLEARGLPTPPWPPVKA